MREEDMAGRSNSVGALLLRVRRFWWLVLAVTVVAVLGGLAATVTSPTTYVGRTSLIVSSNDRSPDQDAVVVQGYVDYFNDTAYQAQLLRSAGVHDDVSLSAADSASSPILVISATTSQPATAQQDAIMVARAFMDDINDVHTTANAEKLAALRAEMQTALTSNSNDAQSVISDLQSQIDQVQSDQVNVLQQLQSKGGVAEQTPSLFGNVVPAGAGGLLLGLLGAVVLARVSRRLHNGAEVADKVGLPTLVELPRAWSAAGRARQDRRLGQLANIARARLDGPGVVAVAQPEDGFAASVVARRLAGEWVRQGYPTVLVSPDDALSVSKVGELLEREILAGHYVVVDAPAVVRSASAQAICHAAAQTILVVDTKITRVPAAREAAAVLRQMGTSLMGVVVASVRKHTNTDQAFQVLGVPGDDEAPVERPKASTPAKA